MHSPKRFWCWLPLWLTSCLVALYLVANPATGTAAGIASAKADSWQAECWDCELAEELAEAAEGVRKARKPVETAAKMGPQPMQAIQTPWDWALAVVPTAQLAIPLEGTKQAFVPTVGLRLALLAEWRK